MKLLRAWMTAPLSGPTRRAVTTALVLALSFNAALAETLVFHASASGKQTLDQGEGGGNPFASSLVDILKRPSFGLSDLPSTLQRLTLEKSRGFQSADVPRIASEESWSLAPGAKGESRSALVLVVSDYTESGGAQSLPGVRYDAERIAAALSLAGFATEVALDLGLMAMRARLAAFSSKSENQDVAVIYTTGHGVEVDGKVFLLPGDYPIHEGNAALKQRAMSLQAVAHSVRARRINMVFYGGCRDNPFGN